MTKTDWIVLSGLAVYLVFLGLMLWALYDHINNS